VAKAKLSISTGLCQLLFVFRFLKSIIVSPSSIIIAI